MTQLALPDPRVGFQTRWAYAAFKAAVSRGEGTIIHRGGRGCAKTMSVCYYLHRLCLAVPGIRQTWMRWERSKMTETVLQTYEDEILGIGHPMRSGSRETRRGYEYPNGSRIMLMGISDDYDATKSLQSDVMYVNECGQLPYGIWDEIGGAARARVGISPAGFRRLKIGDLNPMPPSHWTNQLAAEFPRRLFPHVTDDGTTFGKAFTPQMYEAAQKYNLEPLDRTKHKHKLIQWFPPDNPGYWDFYTWDWTAPGLEYVQNRLGIMGRWRKARYLEGRPVGAEGGVYPEFDEDQHVAKPFPIPPEWPWYVWWDPGYQHPTAIIWIAVAPNNRLIIADEIVQAGQSVQQHCETFLKRMPGRNVRRVFGDPHHAFSRTAQSPETIAQQAARHGVKMVPGPSCRNAAEIESQVNMVRHLLTSSLSDGKPGMQVFSLCTSTINGFQSWSYKRTADGSIPPGDDRFEDINDDEMDCVRGIVASRPTFAQRPLRIIDPDVPRE